MPGLNDWDNRPNYSPLFVCADLDLPWGLGQSIPWEDRSPGSVFKWVSESACHVEPVASTVGLSLSIS